MSAVVLSSEEEEGEESGRSGLAEDGGGSEALRVSGLMFSRGGA